MANNFVKQVKEEEKAPATAPEKKEEETVPSPAPDDTMTIKKDDFEVLMDRLKRLEFAADKSHLSRYDDNHRDKMTKTVKLRMLDGKVVVGWSNMIENTVEKDQHMRWQEKQTVEIFLEDETTKIMDIVVFNRVYTYITATIDDEIKSKEGTKVKVHTEDGREYTLDIRFIN